MARTLRKYQRQAAQYARDAIVSNYRPLIVLPTGAGKTVTAAAVVKELQKINPKKYKNVASLCHTTVLREQIGKRIAGIKSYTIQEFLTNNTRGKVRRLESEDVGVLFVDEAHHIVSTEYRAVLDLFPNAAIFGMSATPERADGTGLGDVFDCMYGSGEEGAPGTTYSQLIDQGYLVDCELEHYEDLSRQRHKEDREVADGVATYLKKCKRKGVGWRPGIFFAKDIATCDKAARDLNKAGVRAESIDCNTEDKAVQDAIHRYIMGDLDVLCSPIKLAEGFDAPRAEVCILSRSCDHISTYLQCVGRVLRPYGEEEIEALIATYGSEVKKSAKIPKVTALLIDCTSAHQVHGLPTKNRVWSLDGKNQKSKPGRKTFEWKPDGRTVRPYSIIELDSSVVEATKISRVKHFEQKLIKEGVSKQRARIQALKETGEISGVRFQEKGFGKTTICTCCGKQIKAMTDCFVKFPDAGDFKPCYYHPDCWITSMPEKSRKTKKVA